MVKVDFKNYTGKELQEFVIRDLKEAITREIGKMKCPRCGKISRVHIHLQKNKLNGMRLEIDACCENFKRKINEALMPNYTS